MRTKRLVLAALLTAVALGLHSAEALLPQLLPIPGVKLGLANIVTVFSMFTLGPVCTLLILIARVLLSAMFSGQALSLLYSLGGGLLCYLAMLFLRRVLTLRRLWACGALGGVFHNLGQLIVAALVMRTAAIAAYLPVLTLSGAVTGLLTGFCAQLLVNRLGGYVRLDKSR